MIRHLVILPLVGIVSAAPLLVNPDFEATPFTNGWTSSGVTEIVGLNGTNKAARLPYNTSASLSQTATGSAADFTFDICFQIAGSGEAQSFRMALLAGGSNAIELRAGTGGVLQVGTGSTYYPLTTITGGASTAIPANQTVKLRVIGRAFGTTAAQYDLLWTAPYTGSEVPAFTQAALSLTAFASPSATSSAIDAIRFQRNIVAANSFTVDELALEDTAAAPGIAATHQVLLPPPPAQDKVVNISGVYPHLAMTNSHLECGVGAVVPWADKLWVITYGPHLSNGSTDKLYVITPQLTRTIRPESVGGTPANRFIHAATNQLNIGPYFISANGQVRTLLPSVAPGRHTATAAHLTDPNRLYIFTMEDGVYDVDARDLSFITRYPDVQGKGDRFLFGYHGKGAYTGQGRFVVANNGRPNDQDTPTGPAGVLATWDGTTVEQNGGSYTNDYLANPTSQGTNPVTPQPQYIAGWNHVSRTQHCEVTGPGGIHGNQDPENDPVWSTGFDAKSVLLHVMENQQWNVWRLPKASYSHDGSHGWHTEWPRIRQLDPTDPHSIYLMHMHGLFFDFPKTFSADNFSGLKPIAGYYKMPTDYCTFEGRIVMGKNDASKFANPLAQKDQSNLWFGTMEDIKNWGAPAGHGAVWMNEVVAAAQVSDAFLINGFPQRTLHLRNRGSAALSVEIQTSEGTPTWTPVRSVNVPANGYTHEILSDLTSPWVRLKASAASTNLTAFFHMGSPYPHGTPASAYRDEFAAIANIRDTQATSDGIIRVMTDSTLSLEFASSRADENGAASSHRYHCIGGDMQLKDVANTTAENALRTTAALTKEFGSDSASAWIDSGGVRFRLPKLDPLYDAQFAAGWARGIREAVTERELLNCHGTFYEVPRSNSGGFRKMRALATHGKRITDFASWRGLFVLTGVLDDAPASDKLVRNADGTAALWLGEIDDLWRMGEPRGKGGPWKDTAVAANTASDPYLMYGYDRKELTLSATEATTITVEMDFLADNTWSIYQTFNLVAGETITHNLPAGFHAHWVRVKSSTATTATAQFAYGPADKRDAFRTIALISPLLAAPDWENEAVFRINKEEPHATRMPFPDAAGALKRPRMESPWCQLLNGEWKFHWVSHPDQRPLDFFKTTFDDASWKTIPVPANVELHGYGTPIYTNVIFPFKKDPPRVMGEPAADWTLKEERNPVSSYRRTFDLPATWRDRRTSITFNGVASAFYLWVNGEKVGYSQDSRTPAKLDITKFVKPTGNVLAVEVYRHSDGSYLEDQDFWRLSGIFRDVYLTSSPMLDLRDFELIAGLDESRTKGTLAIKTWTANHTSKPQPFTVDAKLIDIDGKEIGTHKITGTATPGEDAAGTAAADGLDIKPWTAETPHLYQVLLTLKDSAGKPIAHYATKVGFRTNEIKNGQLLVNGQPILIKGVNRHDHHHITGQYVTEAAMREDLDAMKRLNINAIRTSHYPNDPRFYELCDEYGFYVVCEANIESHGMGYHGDSLAKNPSWGPAHLDRIRNMVEAFKNHACVIMWSMGNEAGDGVNFVECSKWIRNRDATRLVHYQQAVRGNHVDLFTPMYFDIARLNGWCRGEERRPLGQQWPLILCEYNHTMGNSSGGLDDYWEMIKKERLLQGGFIWDWRDQGILTTKEAGGEKLEYFAYGGDFGDRPNSGNFCCNGIVHADLRPNPHSLEVFHQYREIEVTACEATTDKLEITVKNWHFFKDLSGFSGTWTILRNGKPMQTGKFPALSCAPQESVQLSVPAPTKGLSEKDEYHLNVEFSLARDTRWAKAGFVVARDQHPLPWGKRDATPHRSKLAAKLDSNAESATVSGKGFKATFDHKRGTLTSYQIDGREWLAGPLALNFWRPPNDNDRGNGMTQRCGVWRNAGPGATVTKVEAVMKDQAAVLTYELTVPAGKSTSKITYVIHGDGVIEVSAGLHAQGGPEIPRIGMQCQLVGRELDWSWFGRGLEENYRDRKAGYPVGIWNGPVSKLWFPYVKPQETANRTDIRWSTFSDHAGKGIKFEATQDLLEMGAYPFLQSDLEGLPHPVDIPQRDLTTVHVGLGQMGVGGENTWGARPQTKHLFSTNREYAFAFRIVPGGK